MADVPLPTAAPPEPLPPAVTDRRPAPPGVLPRGIQTWIMASVAVVMLVIMLVVGRPTAPARPTPAAAPPQPSADRVRDYQDRLRVLEAQARRDAQSPETVHADPAQSGPDSMPAAGQDPIAEERRRRNYQSLFASSVVLSRRPESERPDQGAPAAAGAASTAASVPSSSVDDVADAVVRATTKAVGAGRGAGTPPVSSLSSSDGRPADAERPITPESTAPLSAAGPLYRIVEGTVIDTVLTNRLDGASAAPVNCLVTNALYAHTGRQVLIPAGARILGETKPVQALGETRLAVSFHRVLMPDGRTYRLDRFIGLNQIGDAGLRDQVNQHYWSTFGAAAAVGLISGLSQALGSAGFTSGDGNRTVVVAGGIGEATARATLQVMNRFLNRLPTITIREGHRVKVYITSDLELPAYTPPLVPRSF